MHGSQDDCIHIQEESLPPHPHHVPDRFRNVGHNRWNDNFWQVGESARPVCHEGEPHDHAEDEVEACDDDDEELGARFRRGR